MLWQPPTNHRSKNTTNNCKSQKNFFKFLTVFCFFFFDLTTFSQPLFIMSSFAHLFKIAKHPLRSLVLAKEIKMKAALFNKCSALSSDTAATVTKSKRCGYKYFCHYLKSKFTTYTGTSPKAEVTSKTFQTHWWFFKVNKVLTRIPPFNYSALIFFLLIIYISVQLYLQIIFIEGFSVSTRTRSTHLVS